MQTTATGETHRTLDRADERRFRELIDKRTARGLSDEEADELGRLFALRRGQVYANATAVRQRSRHRRRQSFHRFRQSLAGHG